MTWLVTGGSGYIGKHVVSELLSGGIDVLVYDKQSYTSQELIPSNFSFIYGDILDEAHLRDILINKEIEGVINLAALKSVSESLTYPELYTSINFEAAANLMDLAIEFKVPYFIQSSSAAVYGNAHFGVVSEKMTTQPISPYGLSKLRAENYLSSLISEKRIVGISLRYFNVAGAGGPLLKDTSSTNIFPIFIDLLRNGKSPNIYGHSLDTKDGTCVRDYIHVIDLAKAHLLAVKRLRRTQLPPVINLGSGTGTSVLEIYENLCTVMDVSIEPIFAPERIGDPVSLIANIKIAESHLKFRPKKSLKDIVISSLY